MTKRKALWQVKRISKRHPMCKRLYPFKHADRSKCDQFARQMKERWRVECIVQPIQ